MSEPELLPCPFCGSKPVEETDFSEDGAGNTIYCENENCNLNLMSFSPEQWNHRPTPPLEAQQGEDFDEILPKVDNQGISFGKHTWISFDRICGWDGEDGEARDRFYQTSIIAKGILEWAKRVKEYVMRRPSQSASREIKWPERMDCNKAAHGYAKGMRHSERNLGKAIGHNECLDACKKAVAESRINECDDLLKAKKSGWDDCIKFYKINESSQSVDLDVKQLIDVWIKTNNVVLTDHQIKQLEVTFATKTTSQSVGMVPISRIDVKLTVEEVLNNRFIGYSRGDHHPTLKGFLPDIVNEVTHAICAKFARPDVKPLVEALEVSLESMQGCDDRQHIKRHDSAIHHAEVALFKYKPNAGRQG